MSSKKAQPESSVGNEEQGWGGTGRLIREPQDTSLKVTVTTLTYFRVFLHFKQ